MCCTHRASIGNIRCNVKQETGRPVIKAIPLNLSSFTTQQTAGPGKRVQLQLSDKFPRNLGGSIGNLQT